MTIKIITDSTSDLPLDLAESLGVTIVPANVIFGQEQFKDRIEMSPAQFYERLVDSPVHPTTSAPSIGQFVEAYESVASDADGIVSIHVSAKLSATYNAAVQASEQVNLDCPIEVIDSEQATFGLGLPVIAAATSAAGGADFDTVVKVARSANERSRCIALFDTLEYLQRGGRIGKAQAMVGSILRVKPMIIVRDGEVQPLGKRPHLRKRPHPDTTGRPRFRPRRKPVRDVQHRRGRRPPARRHHQRPAPRRPGPHRRALGPRRRRSRRSRRRRNRQSHSILSRNNLSPAGG